MDLNKDFKDCNALVYALFHYSFMSRGVQGLEGLAKCGAIGVHDYAGNIRILYNMMAKANLIPLISEDEYHNIK